MPSTTAIEQGQPLFGNSRRHKSPARPVAIFTAVEGTLLGHETFEAKSVYPLLCDLQLARVPLVPVTVMTLEEIAPLAEDLGFCDPMIIEAGGAIARPTANSWSVQALGPSADALIDIVCRVEEESGAQLVVYSVLSERESGQLSGRHGAMLRASLHRRFSEPFTIEKGSASRVAAAAALLGYTLARGPRFYYLTPTRTEGLAFDIVRDELRCTTTIAVGGTAVDASFLSRADVPIIVPRSDGHVDRGLAAKVPRAVIAPEPGDVGWALAVRQVWAAFAATPAMASTP